jgi:NADH-quinone oxidoreductase subunit L
VDLALLAWVPLLPLAGCTALFAVRRLPPRVVAAVGVGSVAASALVTALVGWSWLQGDRQPYVQHLWTWMTVGDFAPRLALRLDGLSLSMLGVVTGVGALIHAFAAWYMHGDPGYRRFFAYMNLFVAMMLVLVLSDDLLGLYLGWEGVGLCSYLLIGFWSHDPANGYAARTAFVTTRVGDTAMAIGLFLLYREFGTLAIPDVLAGAAGSWPSGAPLATAVGLLVLGGAVGKSAQLPLQTWLPYAMAGPTPVSALIHAATMVTAGVYLIARLHPIYLASPAALEAVGWVGALTLLAAGGAALFQRDIKRVLAYSTVSQLGYMFMGLGAGAWSAAIFHLVTHAFFKALLFLAAGAVILALHHEQDIFRMGGLRRKLPLAFLSFVAGGGALAALPFVTSGFWSKEAILAGAWASGHRAWWAMGVGCAFLTALYTTRLVAIVFFGPERTHAHDDRAMLQRAPLAILILLSLVGGAIALPLAGALPASAEEHEGALAPLLEAAAVAAGLAGVALGWWLYGRRPQEAPAETPLRRFAMGGWGFDAAYHAVLIRPLMALVRWSRADVIDQGYGALAAAARGLHGGAARSQSGRLAWYAAGLAAGLLVLVGFALWR